MISPSDSTVEFEVSIGMIIMIIIMSFLVLNFVKVVTIEAPQSINNIM